MDDAPVYVEGWEKLTAQGILMGRQDAPVKVFQFTDLGCPYCRRFDLSIRAVRRAYLSEVALVFINYPIPSSPSSTLAAQALECADRESQAEEFLRVVFAQQDSLGPSLGLILRCRQVFRKLRDSMAVRQVHLSSPDLLRVGCWEGSWGSWVRLR